MNENENKQEKKENHAPKAEPKREEKKETEQAAAKPEDEAREKFLRLAAEFDNYKKRVSRDLEESASVGKAKFIKEMLPVVDEFEIAMLALDKSTDKNMAKGVEMLYSNFMEVLKGNGLKEISCDGRFDPFKHEIIMVRESKEKEGTILEVIKKGYEFSGKLLRPASVIVSKAPTKSEEKENKK